MRYLPNLMIDIGSVLMAYNIYRYVRFSRHVRERGNWDRSRRLFALPILLLILFLAGYLSVTIFGRPDFIIAFILLGGSIFVLIMLLLIQRAVDQIQEQGDISPTIVAEGMKVALITTIFGIIVALVLQVFYNFILSKIERLTSQMEESAITLLDMLMKRKLRNNNR